MRFGISTHLFHDHRLDREHLAQIAAYGFDTIEVFATRSHFDYHDDGGDRALAEWLDGNGADADTASTRRSPRASPAVSGRTRCRMRRRQHQAAGGGARNGSGAADRAGGSRSRRWSCISARRRPRASRATTIARPAFRSAEEICRAGGAARGPRGARGDPERAVDGGVSGDAARAGLERRTAGICLDFGHAHLMGDVADAIETAAEHIVATHVHDNRGARRSPGALSGRSTGTWR